MIIQFAGYFPMHHQKVLLPDPFFLPAMDLPQPVTLVCICSDLPGSTLSMQTRPFGKEPMLWSDGGHSRCRWKINTRLANTVSKVCYERHVEVCEVSGHHSVYPAGLQQIIHCFEQEMIPFELLLVHPCENRRDNYVFGMALHQAASKLQMPLALVCLGTPDGQDLPDTFDWSSAALPIQNQLEAQQMLIKCAKAMARFDIQALCGMNPVLLEQLGCSSYHAFLVFAGVLDIYMTRPVLAKEGGITTPADMFQPVLYQNIHINAYGSRYHRYFYSSLPEEKSVSQKDEITALAHAVVRLYMASQDVLPVENLEVFCIEEVPSGTGLHTQVLVNGILQGESWGLYKEGQENVKTWIRSLVLLAVLDIPSKYLHTLCYEDLQLNLEMLNEPKARLLVPGMIQRGAIV